MSINRFELQIMSLSGIFGDFIYRPQQWPIFLCHKMNNKSLNYKTNFKRNVTYNL